MASQQAEAREGAGEEQELDRCHAKVLCSPGSWGLIIMGIARPAQRHTEQGAGSRERARGGRQLTKFATYLPVALARS